MYRTLIPSVPTKNQGAVARVETSGFQVKGLIIGLIGSFLAAFLEEEKFQMPAQQYVFQYRAVASKAYPTTVKRAMPYQIGVYHSQPTVKRASTTECLDSHFRV